MFLVNSHNRRFTATTHALEREAPQRGRHTFSRSYGVNLPSSLTRVLSRALGYSPRPPESVSSTITKGAPHAAFLGSVGSLGILDQVQTSSPLGLPLKESCRLSLSGPDSSTYWLEHGNTNHRARPTLLRPRLLQRVHWRCRNINLLPITYAFRPRLRDRLTHGRIILPQETLGLRRKDFSSCLSLLMPA